MHQIHIDLKLNMAGKWHVGSGEANLFTDRLIRRNSFRQPYIPASTLRGITREQCERLARRMNMTDPSDPHSNSQLWFVPHNHIASVVDYLFGTKHAESTVYFRDARVNTLHSYPTMTISRTAMYRALGTVREKHLFATEYASPCQLQTTISAWHTQLALPPEQGYLPYAYYFLILGLLSIEAIGGDKSSGKGSCHLELRAIKYNGQTIDLLDFTDQMETILSLWEYYLEEEIV